MKIETCSSKIFCCLEIKYKCVILFFFFFFVFLSFVVVVAISWAAPAAYGVSQARG